MILEINTRELVYDDDLTVVKYKDEVVFRGTFEDFEEYETEEWLDVIDRKDKGDYSFLRFINGDDFGCSGYGEGLWMMMTYDEQNKIYKYENFTLSILDI